MTHPYMPLYVDDYEAATAHLTAAEDGVYTRLLRLCWRTPGCSLPDDDAWVARKIRLTADEYERIAKPVIYEFFIRARGRITQKRLKAEYDDISRKKSARKKAGKSGGDAKALKSNNNTYGNATVLPAYARALPEPNPKPEPNPETRIEQPSLRSARRGPKSEPDGFQEFYSSFPRKTARPAAAKAFAKALGRASLPVLIAGARRYAAERAQEDPAFTKHPATWLNNDCWLDEPIPKKTFQGGRHGGQSSNQPFGATLRQAVRERGGGSIFDHGSQEIIDVTPRRDQDSDSDEKSLFGPAADAA